jgi:hypothetical protein
MPRRLGRPGLVGTMARTAVISGTATAVSGSVAQRQHARAQAASQAAQPQAPSVPSTVHPPASEPPPPAPDALPTTGTTLAELERLVALKQQGLLTDDEFTALKARLIAP